MLSFILKFVKTFFVFFFHLEENALEINRKSPLRIQLLTLASQLLQVDPFHCGQPRVIQRQSDIYPRLDFVLHQLIPQVYPDWKFPSSIVSRIELRLDRRDCLYRPLNKRTKHYKLSIKDSITLSRHAMKSWKANMITILFLFALFPIAKAIHKLGIRRHHLFQLIFQIGHFGR